MNVRYTADIIKHEIDWSVFDGDPENTIECHCGAVFRSHSKYAGKPISRMISKKPCPKCGTNYRLRRISSDPEVWNIK